MQAARAGVSATLRASTSVVLKATQKKVPGSLLLAGARPLLQPDDLRPKGIIDMLTGKEVVAENLNLGVELPNVDLRKASTFTVEDFEALKSISDAAGGIVVFSNQDPSLTVHDHVRFVQMLAESDNTCIEPHAVSLGHPDAPEMLEIIREADAGVVFGENWHSDHSFGTQNLQSNASRRPFSA